MRRITINIDVSGDDLDHCNCRVKECNLQFNLHEVCAVIDSAKGALGSFWGDEGEWSHALMDANGNTCGSIFSTLNGR